MELHQLEQLLALLDDVAAYLRRLPSANEVCPAAHAEPALGRELLIDLVDFKALALRRILDNQTQADPS